jgi:hypothetical protein
MATKLATLLTGKADLVDGKIKTDQIPINVMGIKITVSPTPPSNPNIGDLWIEISET